MYYYVPGDLLDFMGFAYQVCSSDNIRLKKSMENFYSLMSQILQSVTVPPIMVLYFL